MGSQASVGNQRPSSTTARASWTLANESPSSLSDRIRNTTRTANARAKSPHPCQATVSSRSSLPGKSLLHSALVSATPPVRKPSGAGVIDPFGPAVLRSARRLEIQPGDDSLELAVRPAGNSLHTLNEHFEVPNPVA